MTEWRGVRGVTPGREITFLFDGVSIPAFEGQTVAAALIAFGRHHIRRSSHIAAPRGVFCAMGTCFECLVWFEGRAVRACVTQVRDGMVLRSWEPTT